MFDYQWKVGQIAFLAQREHLSEADAAATASIPPPAFGHPTIILRMSEKSGYALVTSVTAFGSGPQNDFLPPWNHPFHCYKPSRMIRSFEGTERPPARGQRPQAPLLCLREGKMMPKKKTSWVYTGWSYIIPVSALVNFNKSACRLELTAASLNNLIHDMNQSSKQFVANWADARVAEAATTTTTPVVTTPGTTTTKTTPVATMPRRSKKATPANATPAPVPATTTPMKAATPSPIKTTTPPVKAATPSPIKTTTPPVKTATLPVKNSAPPVSAMPIKATTPPVKAAAPPAKAVTPPPPVKTVQKRRSWASVAASVAVSG